MALADDYLDWHSRLTREAWRWTRDDAQAQDLASAALEKCLRMERREQEINLNYAYRALRSCWIDLWRHQRLLPCVELSDRYAAESDPLAELRVQALLAFLPIPHQQIYLWILAGYRQAEIAGMLGIPLTAYTKRLERMRAHARKVGFAA